MGSVHFLCLICVLLLVASVVSDSVQHHRRQPTRLPCPWDSPGKITGVGCHFLLQCMKVKIEREVAQSCPTLRPHGLQLTRLLHPWDFPGESTGVGCHRLMCAVDGKCRKPGAPSFAFLSHLETTIYSLRTILLKITE